MSTWIDDYYADVDAMRLEAYVDRHSDDAAVVFGNNPPAVGKEAIRAVRFMTDKQARDYLKSKQDSLSRNDKEIREQHGMKQFLDEKTYRPGFGTFKRKKAAAK